MAPGPQTSFSQCFSSGLRSYLSVTFEAFVSYVSSLTGSFLAISYIYSLNLIHPVTLHYSWTLGHLSDVETLQSFYWILNNGLRLFS